MAVNKKLLALGLALFLAHGLAAGADAPGSMRGRKSKRQKTGIALLETGINIAISAANYWHKYTSFLEDWQFTLSWKDQKRKFFTSEGLRLDSNNFRLNWTHGGAGAIYYNWGRTNGLSVAESTLISLGGSLFWEYFAEWREISSINDHIFTSFGGIDLGETLFQFSNHFRRRPGIANRLGEILFNPLLAFNDMVVGSWPEPRVPLADWHDFRLLLGGRHGGIPMDPEPGTGETALGLSMRLVLAPGYGLAGSGRGHSRGIVDSELLFNISTGSRGVEEFSAATRTVLFGWWWQRVHEDAHGGLHGRYLWLGLVSAWDVFQKRPIVPYDGNDLGQTGQWFPLPQPTQFTDKGSTVHLFGPALTLTQYAGAFTGRLDLQATFDFGMINSLAYNAYSAGHDVWGVKSTLHNWGYYYALGYSLEARLHGALGLLQAWGGVKYQHCDSIEGLDRFQSSILDDGHLRDTRLTAQGGLAFRLPRTPLSISARLEGIERRGSFHEVSRRTVETRFYYQLGISF
jgi:hypothetical protein